MTVLWQQKLVRVVDCTKPGQKLPFIGKVEALTAEFQPLVWEVCEPPPSEYVECEPTSVFPIEIKAGNSWSGKPQLSLEPIIHRYEACQSCLRPIKNPAEGLIIKPKNGEIVLCAACVDELRKMLAG